YMGDSSPEKGPGNRRQLQVDTTQNRQKNILYQMLHGRSFTVNRTVVSVDMYALGILGWKLVGQKFPRSLMRKPPSFDSLRDKFGNGDSKLPSDVVDLFTQCLSVRASLRPNAEQVRDALARHILQHQHRAVAVASGKEYRVDASRPQIRVTGGSGDRVEIRYDGLSFRVGIVEGTVYVNNMVATPGLTLPGCCVISLGVLERPQERIYVTFDVSHPEIDTP
ncbi:MAG: hypothetical protein P4L81_02435, partial [Candidatus Pacebacteria bacterium]|nr:hypothetical protein [Candidatus Paceibacterota bacterium]